MKVVSALFLPLMVALAGLLPSIKASNNNSAATRKEPAAFTGPFESEWGDILHETLAHYNKKNINGSTAEAINKADYECSKATASKVWLNNIIDSIEDLDTLFNLDFTYGVLNWPLWYSWVIDMDDSDEAFDSDTASNGKQEREFQRRFKNLQEFWDIKSDDILLKAMSSSILADTEKMVHLVNYFLVDQEGNGYSNEQARDIVAEVQNFIESDPGLDYNNPLFTFTAFATTSVGFYGNPYVGNVPDNIIMGDGMLEFFDAVGLDKHGPDMILAHEFAHHIQFELERFDLFDPVPEIGRKRELMADAYSAYFLAHKQGASFGKKRIAEAFQTAFDFGDCAFKNPNHHGTPNQREAATMFGASLAQEEGKKNVVMTAAEFLEAFEAGYDELIAPDADNVEP